MAQTELGILNDYALYKSTPSLTHCDRMADRHDFVIVTSWLYIGRKPHTIISSAADVGDPISSHD